MALMTVFFPSVKSIFNDWIDDMRDIYYYFFSEILFLNIFGRIQDIFHNVSLWRLLIGIRSMYYHKHDVITHENPPIFLYNIQIHHIFNILHSNYMHKISKNEPINRLANWYKIMNIFKQVNKFAGFSFADGKHIVRHLIRFILNLCEFNMSKHPHQACLYVCTRWIH